VSLVAILTTAVLAVPTIAKPPEVASTPTPGGAAVQAGRALPVSSGPSRGPTLACIRRWESLTTGLYHAISPGGRYRGAYQFDLKTWEAIGGQGDPATAPPAEQDWRASLLLQLRGLAPWPTPARMCA
jgi:Transglycosylase-like domain